MPTLNKRLPIVLLATLLLMATSCSRLSRNAYSVFRHPDQSCWISDRWLDFEVGETLAQAGADTIGPYDVLLTVRHTEAFPGRTLWLAVETTHPSGNVTTDTLELRLAADSGRWLGAGTHSLYTLTHTLARGVTPGSAYALSIAHASLPDTLPGIKDIGITLIHSQIHPHK